MEKNVGNLDAFLRAILGIFLIWFGLFQLEGLSGNVTGIIVALVSIAPFTFAINRKCPIFFYLKTSTIAKKIKK